MPVVPAMPIVPAMPVVPPLPTVPAVPVSPAVPVVPALPIVPAAPELSPGPLCVHAAATKINAPEHARRCFFTTSSSETDFERSFPRSTRAYANSLDVRVKRISRQIVYRERFSHFSRSFAFLAGMGACACVRDARGPGHPTT
jgi:hypothetical protein